MIDYFHTTGTTGQMRIRDDGFTIELAIKSTSPVAIGQLPWNLIANENEIGWQSYNFNPTTEWQIFGVHPVYVTEDIIFQIGYTDTSLGGPTDFSAKIFRGDADSEALAGSPGAIIQVGQSQKLAIPFVNVNGVWKQVKPWAKHEGVWKETT